MQTREYSLEAPSATFTTLGCKVNQAETRRLADALRARGWHIAESGAASDVAIINSCAVTAESVRKTRQAVRRHKKQHPNALVVLCGCMVTVSENLREALPEADIFLTQEEKETLPDVLHRALKIPAQIPPIAPPIPRTTSVRASVKIQDGCDRFCSYCVIPHARGRAKSTLLDDVLTECRALLTGDTKELVLTGINLSTWGQEWGLTLVDVARAVGALPGLLRLRLGSLEPYLLTDTVCTQLAEIPALCPHFHISLQSGSDKILHAMNRHYSAAQYAALCATLRQRVPGCSITTDILTGFPGETQDDFAETMQFAMNIAFEKVHIFPFSARPGTRAFTLPDPLPRAEKERRARELGAAMRGIRQQYLQSNVGQTVEILVEERDGEGFLCGYTPNYTAVRARGDADIGTLQNVVITGVAGDLCVGDVLL
ncbi:MAG: tRNA (N(6)-L-threonylcarbamoyladenosine(37)-C(2))-methylthiotransferase MtaB [Oscillospiraceae bacterium]|jgi:threonylcarbamoyladenosine tRNA methylthiotransferase MtaB|nr:tRNA (N(6)-L-threonylcarbamoyladenosine(37)-C(2))-methylthiotransferase MtaB [Oscillospiraceae bacterium]